jgi:hypothetical protein
VHTWTYTYQPRAMTCRRAELVFGEEQEPCRPGLSSWWKPGWADHSSARDDFRLIPPPPKPGSKPYSISLILYQGVIFHNPKSITQKI